MDDKLKGSAVFFAKSGNKTGVKWGIDNPFLSGLGWIL